MDKYKKQPAENIDFGFNFADWLADRANDTIMSISVTGEAGLTITNQSHSAGIVRYFAAGGAHNVSYKVTCQIMTTGGRIKEYEHIIAVKEV